MYTYRLHRFSPKNTHTHAHARTKLLQRNLFWAAIPQPTAGTDAWASTLKSVPGLSGTCHLLTEHREAPLHTEGLCGGVLSLLSLSTPHPPHSVALKLCTLRTNLGHHSQSKRRDPRTATDCASGTAATPSLRSRSQSQWAQVLEAVS